MKLKSKLLVIVYFLVFTPAFFMFLAAVSQAERQSVSSMEKRLEAVAIIEENNIGHIFEDYQNRMLSITSRTRFRDLLEEYDLNEDAAFLASLEAILEEAVEPFDDVRRVLLYSTDGELLVELGEKEVNIDDPHELFGFQQNIHFSSFDESAYFRERIYREDQNLGTLILSFDAERILDSLGDYSTLGETGEILLAYKSDEGKAVFINDRRFDEDAFPLASVSMTSVDVPMVQALLNNEDVFFDLVDYRGQSVAAATRYLDDFGWGLVVKMDTLELREDLREFTLFILIIQLILLVLVILISNVLTRFVVDPILDLTDLADAISNGKLDARFPRYVTEKEDEIGLLARTMKGMLHNIRDAKDNLERRVKERTKELNQAKRSLEQHAKELEKFKMAMDTTSEQVIITDADAVVLYANQAVEKMTGYSVKEVLGTKAGQLWGGLMSKMFYRKLWKTLSVKKEAFVGEIRHKRKNGEIFESLVSIAPVTNNRGEVEFYIAVYRDITKEKNIDRMKTEFLSLASHQLRTPLSAIAWMTEILLDEQIGKLNKKQFKAMESIYQSNRRMVDLVNALLNISRIESGRIRIDPVPTDVKALIEEVLAELQPAIDLHKHKIVISMHDAIDKVKLDRRMIYEVYKNFISNAIKYTPNGGEIHIFVSMRNGSLVSQVSDNGFGIPKKDQHRLFEKFFRASNILKQETDGTGLGLYLVKSVIESSGGRVWFKSQEGKGSSFFFSLPKSGMKRIKGEVGLS